MTDELNAAARIIAIVADSLAGLQLAPPNSRAASDRLDYLVVQVDAYRRAWSSSRFYPATEAYVVALMEAAAGASISHDLPESGLQKESAPISYS